MTKDNNMKNITKRVSANSSFTTDSLFNLFQENIFFYSTFNETIVHFKIFHKYLGKIEIEVRELHYEIIKNTELVL